MKDVAKAAGVSIGTVSKVINKSGFVRPQIRERVLLAISLLNYKPNGIARSLKNSKTNIIGVILPGLNDLYSMRILNSIEKVASTKGYKIIYCSTNGEVAREIKSLQWLIEKRVDGILFYPSSEELTDVEIPASIPVVLLERQIKGYNFTAIMHEHIEACRQLIEPLTNKDFQKIIFFHGPIRSSIEWSKVDGIYKTLEYLGIESEDQLFIEVNVKQDKRALTDFMSKTLLKRQEVTAVLSTNPTLLSASIRACQNIELSLEEDIEVCGFGDIDPYGIIMPPIRIAEEQPEELAKVAFNALFEQISKPTKKLNQTFFITHKLIN